MREGRGFAPPAVSRVRGPTVRRGSARVSGSPEVLRYGGIVGA